MATCYCVALNSGECCEANGNLQNAPKITKIFAILTLPKQLNREEMKRIEKSDKAFSLMDRNRDNSISVEEFIKVDKAEASEKYS